MSNSLISGRNQFIASPEETQARTLLLTGLEFWEPVKEQLQNWPMMQVAEFESYLHLMVATPILVSIIDTSFQLPAAGEFAERTLLFNLLHA